MATRKSGPLDAMVGARIRMVRVDRGMSQAMLAERIGITSHQMQRYERGISRVGASGLSRIASVLGVSVGELFESSQTVSPSLGSPMRLLAEPEAQRMLKAYARMTDPVVRLCFTKLIESIADRAPGATATVARLDLHRHDEHCRSPSQG